jgi:hypothetical protein
LFTSFKQENELESLKSILKATSNNNNFSLYTEYLIQATGLSYNDMVSLLKEIDVRNKCGEWVSAFKVTWDIDNIRNEYLVDSKIEAILKNNRIYPQIDNIIISTNQLVDLLFSDELITDFESEENKLLNFIKTHLNDVHDLLKSVFMLMVSAKGKLGLEASRLYRRFGYDSVEYLLSEVIPDTKETLLIKQSRYSLAFDMVQPHHLVFKSLANSDLVVTVSDEITSLIVPFPTNDPSVTVPHYTRSPNEPNRHYHHIRFLNGFNANNINEIVINTIDRIHQIFTGKSNPNLKVKLNQLSSDIRTVRVVQSTLELNFLHRLKELSLRKNILFSEISKLYGTKQEVEATLHALRSDNSSSREFEKNKNEIEEINSKISDTFQKIFRGNDVSLQNELIKGLRKKIKDFQYTAESIPFELWQNADDAACELDYHADPLLSEITPTFSIAKTILDNQEYIVFGHWGRLINEQEFYCIGGENRGFKYDLENMLTLNISEKDSVVKDGKLELTGKFGLGFKSVFLVSDMPVIVSGALECMILGGFYPVTVSMGHDNLKNLISDIYESNTMSSSLSRQRLTTIILPINSDNSELVSFTKGLEKFELLKVLLILFSKKIKHIDLQLSSRLRIPYSQKSNSIDKLDWKWIKNDSRSIWFFKRIATTSGVASIVFQISKVGFEYPNDNVPRIWITTPLAESASGPIILNAPFNPDAGRQRVAANTKENHLILAEIKKSACQALADLYTFCVQSENFKTLKNKLDIDQETSLYSFWKSLWDSSKTALKPAFGEMHSGGDIINELLIGEGGMLSSLWYDYNSVPNGLPGDFEKLVKAREISAVVHLSGSHDHVISDVNLRVILSGDNTFSEKLNSHTIVSANIWNKLNELNIVRNVSIIEINWEWILNELITTDGFISIKNASVLNKLFENVDHYSCRYILDTLFPNGIKLLNNRNQEKLSNELLYKSNDEIICSIAPLETQFNEDYYDSSDFLLSLVDSIDYNSPNFIEKLYEWVFDFEVLSNKQIISVIEYLIIGRDKLKLADMLGNMWLEKLKLTEEFQGLPKKRRNSILELFQLGKNEIEFLQSDYEQFGFYFEPENEINPIEAFSKIVEWWKLDGNKHEIEYQKRTYHDNFLLSRNSLVEGISDYQQGDILSVFVEGALVALGFNKIGRNKIFHNFAKSNGLIDGLINSRDNSNQLMKFLDEYLDPYKSELLHSHPMRQFISFYATGRYLFEYLDALKIMDNDEMDIQGSKGLSPNISPHLTGTGINAVDLGSMIGKGKSHIIRELYRFGYLKSSTGLKSAFLPIRKVRNICINLFDINARSSEDIFQGLLNLSGQDLSKATFNYSFDIPLQILAEDDKLRVDVLGKDFTADSRDEFEFRTELENRYGLNY